MLITRLTLKKLFSFNNSAIELRQLNVLIGPNAVGKSNLIEAIGLLQAAPSSLSTAILRAGGVRQVAWLGDTAGSPIASLDCELTLRRGGQFGPVNYHLEFSEDARGFVILRERIAKAEPDPGSNGVYLDRENNGTRVASYSPKLTLSPGAIFLPPTESMLSQFKNPADPTPITEVGRHLSEIRIFREFRTGPQSAARYGVSTSVPKDALDDGGDNLALVLNELDFLGQHDRIKSYLSRFCERFEDLKVRVGEGLARTFLREAGLIEMLSAIRMSDGTFKEHAQDGRGIKRPPEGLRSVSSLVVARIRALCALKFLSLLAALFHPSPPPLMCIEEPEVGLHPDALQLVAEALLEASQSMQLIVTTHSEALVDALTDRPESVLVCERDFDNGTQMNRLSKEHLKDWLEHYTLGQLWRRGEIGGGRW